MSDDPTQKSAVDAARRVQGRLHFACEACRARKWFYITVCRPRAVRETAGQLSGATGDWMMRVLLVFAESYMNPRMGIMHLASILKIQGHEVRFANAERLGLKGLHALVKEWKPGIVGYTAMTGEHVRLLALNRALKRDLSFVAVFGGPHATFCPDELLADASCDAACVGEADVAFPEFCRKLDVGEPWEDTPNFVVRQGGRTVHNPLLPLVEDLDSLPMPDHELMYEADPGLAADGVKYFYSNRGCPCSCTYCFHPAFNKMYRGKGAVVRQRSPEKVVDEMCRIKERYPMTHMCMIDDSFFLNSDEWFDRFCADYKKRVALPFMCDFRANNSEEDRIRQLRDAGLFLATIGVECGNESHSYTLLKRELSKDQIRRAAGMIKRNGIFLVTANIFGLPVPDSFKVDMETLAFNVELGADWARSAITYPYQGTEIRDYAIKAGLLPEGHVPLFETNKQSSAFMFASRLEKRKTENMSKLFDVFVQHPWLRRRAEFLCALPLGWFYGVVWYLRFGYVWKFKVVPFTSFWTEVWKFLPILYKLVRKS
jgi:radical SAM superfamily enzyme YgiQ (UPF0313 family)